MSKIAKIKGRVWWLHVCFSCATWPIMGVFHFLAPRWTLSKISFIDTDLDMNRIGGVVTVTNVGHEIDVDEYILYFGSSSTQRKERITSWVIPKRDRRNFTFVFPEGTEVINNGKLYLLLYGSNDNGEALGVSVRIGDTYRIGTCINVNKRYGVYNDSKPAPDDKLNPSHDNDWESCQNACRASSNCTHFNFIMHNEDEARCFFLDGAKLIREADGFIAGPAVCPPVPLGLIFIDTHSEAGTIGGIVTIQTPADETLITHYSVRLRIQRSAKGFRLGILPKKGADFSFILPVVPNYKVMAYMSVFPVVVNFGELSYGLETMIIDLSAPQNPPRAVLFVDTDLTRGMIEGIITVIGPVNDYGLDSYVLYWGTSPSNETTEIGKILKGEDHILEIPRGTSVTGNKYILAFAQKNNVKELRGTWIKLKDNIGPLYSPRAIRFIDQDLNGGQIGGFLTVIRAWDESDFIYYCVYLGESPTDKALKIAIKVKTGRNLVFVIPKNTGVTYFSHIIVVTQNEDGDSPPSFIILIDRAVPRNAPSAIEFTDTDKDGHEISGIITIHPALFEGDIKHYVLYRSESCDRELEDEFLLDTLTPTGGNLTHTILSDTKITVYGWKTFIVISRNDDGLSFSDQCIRINDTFTKGPAMPPGHLEFFDHSGKQNVVQGIVSITRAITEADITHYDIHLATSTDKKDPKLGSVFKTQPGDLLIFIIDLSTLNEATHFRVYSRNAYGGERFSELLIKDRKVPASGPAALQFTDINVEAGKFSGTVTITKAEDEKDIFEYILIVTHIYDDLPAGAPSVGDFHTSLVQSKLRNGLSHTIQIENLDTSDGDILFAFTNNSDGLSYKYVMLFVTDRKVPVNLPSVVEFIDLNPLELYIHGIFSMKPMKNNLGIAIENDINDYEVYLGESAFKKTTFLFSLEATGTDKTYLLPKTKILVSEKYILVYSKNSLGTSAEARSIKIFDFVIPPPARITFLDLDPDPFSIGGTVTIVRAQNETVIDSYHIFYGLGRFEPTELIQVIPKTQGSADIVTFSIPIGTKVDSNINPLWLLVYSRNMNSSYSTETLGIGIEIMKASLNPCPLAFTDMDVEDKLIGGMLYINNSMNTIQISSFIVKLGTSLNESMQILGTVPVANIATNRIIDFSVPKNTKINDASAFFVYVEVDGYISRIVSTLDIIDYTKNSLPTIVFVDVDERKGKIGGTVTIFKADDDSSISAYVLYWGFNGRKVVGFRRDFAVGRDTYSHPIQLGTLLVGKNQLVVILKDSRGKEGSRRATLKLLDKVEEYPPYSPPMAVSFTDEDPDSNKLGGQITVHPAVDQDNIFSYSLYWSSEMPNLLAPKQGLVKFGEALACSGCDAIYVLESNYLLRDIQYFVAFSKNPYGESNKFAFTEVKDLFVPRNSLSFYDKDLDRHEISGIITVNHATNNPLILTWHVYLGTARQWNILDLAKKDAVDELVFIIPDNTVSEALTHIFADGLNHLGTSIDARLLKIHDRAVPLSKAKSVTFTDKDEKSQRISGTVEIEAEIDDVHQEGITAFAVYIGTKKEKIEYLHLATLTQGDVWSKVIENVSTISKTHLRIYAVNEDGQSQNSFLLLFVDVALPKELGRGVKFIDQNNQACVVEGKATLLVVSDGTDIKSYVVYYGRNSFSRSNLLQELQVIPGQKEVSFNIPSNTPIDFNHTHLLIYSKNDIGESEEFLSVVINDNPGTGPHHPSGLAFTDKDGNGGQISGTVTISPALEESCVTHYMLYWSQTPEGIGEEAATIRIAELPAIGSPMVHVFYNNTSILRPYLVARTRNSNRQSTKAVFVKISDNTVDPYIAKPTLSNILPRDFVFPIVQEAIYYKFSPVADAFKTFDAEGDGYLSDTEFKEFLKKHDSSISDDLGHKLYAAVLRNDRNSPCRETANSDGRVSVGQFLAMFGALRTENFKFELINRVRRRFDNPAAAFVIPVRTGPNIDLKSFTQLIRQLNYTEADAPIIFSCANWDGDDQISKLDWESYFTYNDPKSFVRHRISSAFSAAELAFEYFDENIDNLMGIDELKKFVDTSGANVSDVDRLFETVKEDMTGDITAAMFMKSFGVSLSELNETLARDRYHPHDMDIDEDGFVSRAELQQGFEKLGLPMADSYVLIDNILESAGFVPMIKFKTKLGTKLIEPTRDLLRAYVSESFSPYEKAFKEMDIDDDKNVNKREFNRLWALTGLDLTYGNNVLMDELFNGKASIGLTDFLRHFGYNLRSTRRLLIVKQAKQITEVFKELPKDEYQRISSSTMIQMLLATGLPKKESNLLAKEIDDNKNGHIEESEFLLAFSEIAEEITQNIYRHTSPEDIFFTKFDSDKNGLLQHEEMQRGLEYVLAETPYSTGIIFTVIEIMYKNGVTIDRLEIREAFGVSLRMLRERIDDAALDFFTDDKLLLAFRMFDTQPAGGGLDKADQDALFDRFQIANVNRNRLAAIIDDDGDGVFKKVEFDAALSSPPLLQSIRYTEDFGRIIFAFNRKVKAINRDVCKIFDEFTRGSFGVGAVCEEDRHQIVVELNENVSIPIGTEFVVKANTVVDYYTFDILGIPSNEAPLTRILEESSRGKIADPTLNLRFSPILSPCAGESVVEVEVTQSFGKAVSMNWKCHRAASGPAKRMCLSLIAENAPLQHAYGVLGGFKRFDITPQDILTAAERALLTSDEITVELVLNVRTFLGFIASTIIKLNVSSSNAIAPNVLPLRSAVQFNSFTDAEIELQLLIPDEEDPTFTSHSCRSYNADDLSVTWYSQQLALSTMSTLDIHYLLSSTSKGDLFPNSHTNNALTLKIKQNTLTTNREYVFHADVKIANSIVTIPIYVKVVDNPVRQSALTAPTVVSNECDFELDASMSLGVGQQADIERCPGLAPLNHLRYSDSVKDGISNIEWFCFRFITLGTSSFYEKNQINVDDPPLGSRPCIGNGKMGLQPVGSGRTQRHAFSSQGSKHLAIPSGTITPGRILFAVRVRSSDPEHHISWMNTHIIGTKVPISIQLDPLPAIISPHKEYVFSAKAFFGRGCSLWQEKSFASNIRSYLRPALDKEKWIPLDVLPQIIEDEIILLRLRRFLVTPGQKYYLMVFISDNIAALVLNVIQSETSLVSNQVQSTRSHHPIMVDKPPRVIGISAKNEAGIPSVSAIVSSVTLSIAASFPTQSPERTLIYSFLVSSSPIISDFSEVYFIVQDSISPTVRTRFSGTTELSYIFGRARTAHGTTCFLKCDNDITSQYHDLCAPNRGNVPLCPKLTISIKPPTHNVAIHVLLGKMVKSWDPLTLVGDVHTLVNAFNANKSTVKDSGSSSFMSETGTEIVKILQKAFKLRSDQTATGISLALLSSSVSFIAAWERTTGLKNIASADISLLLALVKESLEYAGCNWPERLTVRMVNLVSVISRALAEGFFDNHKSAISLRVLGIMNMLKSLVAIAQTPLDTPLQIIENNLLMSVRVVRDYTLKSQYVDNTISIPRLEFDPSILEMSTHADPRKDFSANEIPKPFNLSRPLSSYCGEKTTRITVVQWPSNPYYTVGSGSVDVIEADPSQLFAIDMIKCGRSLELRHLPENITFTLNVSQRIHDIAKITSRDPICTFWDIRTGSWSSLGCESLFDVEAQSLKCLCNHLSAFTVGIQQARVSNVQVDSSDQVESFLGRLSIDNYLFWLIIIIFILLWLPWVVLLPKDNADWVEPEKRVQAFFLDEFLRRDISDKCRVWKGYRVLVLTFIGPLFCNWKDCQMCEYCYKLLCSPLFLFRILYRIVCCRTREKTIVELENDIAKQMQIDLLNPSRKPKSESAQLEHQITESISAQVDKDDLEMRHQLTLGLMAMRYLNMKTIDPLENLPAVSLCNRGFFRVYGPIEGKWRTFTVAVLHVANVQLYYDTMKRLRQRRLYETRSASVSKAMVINRRIAIKHREALSEIVWLRTWMNGDKGIELITAYESLQKSVSRRLRTTMESSKGPCWFFRVVAENIDVDIERYRKKNINIIPEEDGDPNECLLWGNHQNGCLCIHPAKFVKSRPGRMLLDCGGPATVIPFHKITSIETRNLSAGSDICIYGAKKELFIKLRSSSFESSAKLSDIEQYLQDAKKLADFSLDNPSPAILNGTKVVKDLFPGAINSLRHISASSCFFDYDGALPWSATDCLVNDENSHVFWTHDGLLLNFQRSEQPLCRELFIDTPPEEKGSIPENAKTTLEYQTTENPIASKFRLYVPEVHSLSHHQLSISESSDALPTLHESDFPIEYSSSLLRISQTSERVPRSQRREHRRKHSSESPSAQESHVDVDVTDGSHTQQLANILVSSEYTHGSPPPDLDHPWFESYWSSTSAQSPSSSRLSPAPFESDPATYETAPSEIGRSVYSSRSSRHTPAPFESDPATYETAPSEIGRSVYSSRSSRHTPAPLEYDTRPHRTAPSEPTKSVYSSRSSRHRPAPSVTRRSNYSSRSYRRGSDTGRSDYTVRSSRRKSARPDTGRSLEDSTPVDTDPEGLLEIYDNYNPPNDLSPEDLTPGVLGRNVGIHAYLTDSINHVELVKGMSDMPISFTNFNNDKVKLHFKDNSHLEVGFQHPNIAQEFAVNVLKVKLDVTERTKSQTHDAINEKLFLPTQAQYLIEKQVNPNKIPRIATKLQFQRWKECKILKQVFLRAHPVPAFWTYCSFVNRVQRYAVFETGVLFSILVASFVYFNCTNNLSYICKAWSPTATEVSKGSSLYVSLIALVCGLVVGRLLRWCFLKLPIPQETSPREKAIQLILWKTIDHTAWFFVYLLNLVGIIWVVYYNLVFCHLKAFCHFCSAVCWRRSFTFVQKGDLLHVIQWYWSVLFICLFRLVGIPCLSTAMWWLLLIVGKYYSAADFLLVAQPWLLDLGPSIILPKRRVARSSRVLSSLHDRDYSAKSSKPPDDPPNAESLNNVVSPLEHGNHEVLPRNTGITNTGLENMHVTDADVKYSNRSVISPSCITDNMHFNKIDYNSLESPKLSQREIEMYDDIGTSVSRRPPVDEQQYQLQQPPMETIKE